jgi:DNA-binding transcriptional ArsR family regulator
MSKVEDYHADLQELARFAKAISHPARLSILNYLAESKTCISGDISDYLPLSRSTVFQHLNELKSLGLIHGEIDGAKKNYCLCNSTLSKYKELFNNVFDKLDGVHIDCKC